MKRTLIIIITTIFVFSMVYIPFDSAFAQDEVVISPSPSQPSETEQNEDAQPSSSPKPTEQPSSEPSDEPSLEPSLSPEPSSDPSAQPSAEPEPSSEPSEQPSSEPSESPESTEEPSPKPSETLEPSLEPSESPQPSESPEPTEEQVDEEDVVFNTDSVVTTADGIVFDTSTGTITGYNGNAITLDIPSSIGGASVVAIGSFAFMNASSLRTINLPYTVSLIGLCAFNVCNNLQAINVDNGNSNFTSVDGIIYTSNMNKIIRYPSGKYGDKFSVPNSVVTIGDNTFDSCEYLEEISMSNGVQTIGDAVFALSARLIKVTIPSTVSTIGSYAFNGHSSQLKLYGINGSYAQFYANENDIPFEAIGGSTVTTSDGIVFDTNTGTITGYIGEAITLNIPNLIEGVEVKAIADNAMRNNAVVESVTLPDTVAQIGDHAFRNCDSLVTVSFSNIDTIGESAFDECDGLLEIIIPQSVKSIGRNAFTNCARLSSIYVHDNNNTYSSVDGVLFDKDRTLLITFPRNKNTQKYIVPNTVIEINEFAFYKSNFLTNIEMHNTISRIGAQVFFGCEKLKSVIISQSVSEITAWMFNGCSSLEYVLIPSSVTSISDETFLNCNSNFIIGGAIGTYAETYANANGIAFNPLEETKKAIIVLPGIMGSELFGTNYFGKEIELWGGTGSSAFSIVEGFLKCKDTGESIYEVYPTPADKMITSFPFSEDNYEYDFGAFDTYKDLMEDLTKNFNPRGFDVVFYSYDWRMSNKDSALLVRSFLRENDYDEIYIVAHSMGGIVASQLIENCTNDLKGKIKHIITLGTPLIGSPEALWTMQTGMSEAIPLVLRPDLSESIKNLGVNLAGFYELFVSEYYDMNEETTSVDVANWLYQYKNYDLENINDVQKLYNDDIYENSIDVKKNIYNGNSHSLQNFKDEDGNIKHTQFYGDKKGGATSGVTYMYMLEPFQGYSSINSFSSAMQHISDISCREALKKPFDFYIYDKHNCNGDGSVPTYSATIGNSLSNMIAVVDDIPDDNNDETDDKFNRLIDSRNDIDGLDHTGLAKNPWVFEGIKQIILYGSTSVGDIKDARPSGWDEINKVEIKHVGRYPIEYLQKSGEGYSLESTEYKEEIKIRLVGDAELYIYDLTDNLLASITDELSEDFEEYGRLDILPAKLNNGVGLRIAYINKGDYKVVVKGTGEDEILYEIQEFNAQNEKTTVVTFENIEVGENTVIETETDDNNQDAQLEIDKDGDGQADEVEEPTLVKDETTLEDTTDPTVQIALDNTIENQGTITVNGNDEESGLHKLTYAYQINRSNVGGGGDYTESVTFTENGFYEVSGYAQDKNENFAQSETVSFTISDPDINKDGKIDMLDITLVAMEYGLNLNIEEYSNIPDVTCDGVINLFDLVKVSSNM